jgi:hypothetical protein
MACVSITNYFQTVSLASNLMVSVSLNLGVFVAIAVSFRFSTFNAGIIYSFITNASGSKFPPKLP